MISIGNDIVDLNFIDQTRTQSGPFYTKILSETEQQLYRTNFNNIPFWQYIWLLWSCKEAVYKFAKRLQPDLVFTPVKICLVEPKFTELKSLEQPPIVLKFVHQGEEYYTYSLNTGNYIETIANNIPDFSTIVSDVVCIDQTDHHHQSAEVRKHFLTKLNALYPGKDFTVAKSGPGFPVILENGIDSGVLASFAHHGNYVAYAFKERNLF